MNKLIQTVFFSISLFLLVSFTDTAFSQEIIVYSARKEHLIKPVFELYTKETGVRIKYITDKAPVLLQRIKAEGENTPADLLITVDAGNLWHAANQGILQSVQSDILTSNIPSHLRDPENKWFGLSLRARTIVYSTKRVQPDELSTYEDLAKADWTESLSHPSRDFVPGRRSPAYFLGRRRCPSPLVVF